MIQAAIFRAIEESLESPKSSLRSSFEFCLFRIQIDGTLDEICRMNFPSRLRESTVLRCCIFDYLAVTLQSNFIHFLRLQHISNQTQVTKKFTTDVKNMEVNRLLGWAVSKLKHHYERKYHAKKYAKTKKSVDAILDADAAAGIAKYLGNMKIFHHEAIVDETYMALYYDSTTQILNMAA